MKNMFLICNAHLDPMWQWEWQEGAGAALSTFRSAAALCEEYDLFIFNHNEALLYQWIEEYEPELFDRIRHLVEAGRWHIIGGWYLQPDCNLPCGESFLRQIKTGRDYFAEKFGAAPACAINFDSFGHSRGLVQILKKCGYDSYLICRPGECNPPLPDTRFLWEGFAGSSIRVIKMPSYNTPLGQSAARIREEMERQSDRENGLILWGVGNHGGGPSRKDLDDIAALMEEEKDVRILHATPEELFLQIPEEGLPVYDKSLRPSMVGCYLSQIRMKQLHRKLENELLKAEKMAAAAALTCGMDYPDDELNRAWKDLLFAEFHDVLPGSSIQPVEEGGIALLHHGLEEASRVKARAYFRLSTGQTGAEDGEYPILAYNPHPYPAETDVICEMMLADQNYNDEFVTMIVKDENGTVLPSQVEKEESSLPIQWRKRVVFHTVLAPCSMNRFRAFAEILPAKPAYQIPVQDDCLVLNAPCASVRISRKTGLLKSYEVDGISRLAEGSGSLRVYQDSEDPWGMTVTSYQNLTGTFSLASPALCAKICGIKADSLEPVRVIEDGDIRTVAEVVMALDSSFAILRYTFSKQTGRLGLSIRLHFLENERLVKYCLYPALTAPEILGKTAFGLEEHPLDGTETTAGEYLVCHDGSSAFSVSNTGTYAFSWNSGELGLSLLHTPAYCAHPIGDRLILAQDRYNAHMDQGPTTFSFEFGASGLADRLEHIQSESDLLNQPPEVLCFFPSGTGNAPGVFASIDSSAVQLSSCYRNERGTLTLRLFNSTPAEKETTVSIPALSIRQTVSLLPFEVKCYEAKDSGLSECPTLTGV